MKYTKEQFLKAAELGEVSMIDAKHIVSLLDEVVELPEQNDDVMEDDLPTANELYIQLGFMPKHHQLGYDIKTAMEEFAKLHVKYAVKKAKENTYTEEQVKEAIDMARTQKGYVSYEFTENDIIKYLNTNNERT